MIDTILKQDLAHVLLALAMAHSENNPAFISALAAVAVAFGLGDTANEIMARYERMVDGEIVHAPGVR